jgi:hypothetical protein
MMLELEQQPLALQCRDRRWLILLHAELTRHRIILDDDGFSGFFKTRWV